MIATMTVNAAVRPLRRARDLAALAFVFALALPSSERAGGAQTAPGQPSAPQVQPQPRSANPASPAVTPGQARPEQRGSDPRSVEVPGPIKADPPSVDFGIVEPGSTVSAVIKLINPLDRDVRIRAAKPSCTCTTIDMVGKLIPAGGSIEMPMSIKTSHTPGTKPAVVNMAFDGFDQVLVVKIEAETAYAVRATPNFIDALAAERMTGTFELVSSDGTPFVVTSVDGRAPVATDGAPMQPAVRHALRYDFTSPSPLSKGVLNVPPFLIVETNHPKCPILDLRVRHETTRITPAFGFAEFRANCGVLSPKGSTEFELEIKHMGAARIGSVVSLNPKARTEIVSQKPDGSSVLVTVRVTDLGLPPGPFLFPCRFSGNGKQSDFWLFGSVR